MFFLGRYGPFKFDDKFQATILDLKKAFGDEIGMNLADNPNRARFFEYPSGLEKIVVSGSRTEADDSSTLDR